MSLLHSGSTASDSKLYPEDVFSTYLYTGNGSTQTINNGIDLAGKGGMVWIKNRIGAISHMIQDTERTANNTLNSDTTAANAYDVNTNFSFNSNGFSMQNNYAALNYSTTMTNYASWTFRKAPKFFDIVTYTGNGVAGRQIPHSLGCDVGMIVVKCTSFDTYWGVYHRGLAETYALELNSTGSQQQHGYFPVNPTSSIFTVGSGQDVNASVKTYVAYLFAHDPSAD